MTAGDDLPEARPADARAPAPLPAAPGAPGAPPSATPTASATPPEAATPPADAATPADAPPDPGTGPDAGAARDAPSPADADPQAVMHPASSLIAFTTLTGAGFGLIAALGLGLAREDNSWEPWLATVLALALCLGGLAASTRHLGNPQRALLAFREWRTSWLSREAALAAATLAAFGLHMALWLLLGLRLWPLGLAVAALALATIFATAKIYHQLRTVPRWSGPPTPLLFLALGGSGGLLALSAVEALLGYPPSLTVWKAAIALILAGLAAQLWGAVAAETTRAAGGSTPETATGLGPQGTVRQLDPPHTSPNWLLKEMVYETGRRRARALRIAAVTLGLAVPMALAFLTDLAGGRLWLPLAFLSHLAGTAAHRWLFFAEAEHVVGLYYGKR